MHTAHSRRPVPKSTTKRTKSRTTDVRNRLASVDAPAMPDYLAAKVTDAIATESARRGFDTESTRRRLVTSR